MYRTTTTNRHDRFIARLEWEARVYLAWQLFTFTCGLFGGSLALFFAACWVTR